MTMSGITSICAVALACFMLMNIRMHGSIYTCIHLVDVSIQLGMFLFLSTLFICLLVCLSIHFYIFIHLSFLHVLQGLYCQSP